MPLGRTWQVVAGSAAIGVLVAGGAIAASGPWRGGQRTAERSSAAARDATGRPRAAQAGQAAAAAPQGAAPAVVPAAAPVLAPAGAGTGAAPSSAAERTRLDPLLTAYGMGTLSTGVVVDAATGKVLYDHGDGTATTPASTTKLATATAALGLLGPDARLTTDVVAAGGDRVVLVGGGDPTLRLEQLAADTAAALKARGTTTVRLGYDTSLYTGALLHPIGRNDNLAPVTPLMENEGRLDTSTSGPAPRAYDPAATAAADFATLLGKHGVTVRGTPAAASGHGGSVLAAHRSAPLSDLVEQMLTESDNDLAEALARQAALASGRPVSFAGGAAAIRAALTRYGVPLPHASFNDGSGLDHSDALAPLTLARLLALAASPDHHELRPVLSGIPVAGFTGTLSTRFQGSGEAGLIRAKTGTLTGTNTIAGTTTTASGRLLVFAFMTQGTSLPTAAETALDHLAEAVAGP